MYAVGPAVALLALSRRGFGRTVGLERVGGWRWYVPSVLVPIEWLLPPALILLAVGEVPTDSPAFHLLGFAVGLGGVALLLWASVALGRFLVHQAAVFPDHALVTAGPYRYVRHPIYTGYLALLLGSGLGTQNVLLLLLWPISLLGILVQARSEERLLESRFDSDYRRYATCTGQLIPRVRGRAG